MTQHGLVVITALVVAACTGGATPSTPEATEPVDVGFTDYDIAFSVANLNGMGGGNYDATYTFVVRDGEITSCEVTNIGENAAMAEGVCDHVTSPIEFLLSWSTRFDPEHTSVEYDPESQLPTRIVYDNPETADEEVTVQLLRFEQP